MKKRHFIAILVTAAFSRQNLQAQDSTLNYKPKTVSVEEMVGDKRQFLQLMVNQVFVEKKKIGLLSVSTYAADYQMDLPTIMTAIV